MEDQFSGVGTRAGIAALIVLAMLTGCSRASLLGGPGPEVAHHASPAESERLAVLEPVRKFKTLDGCKAHLQELSQEHGGGEMVQISDKEYRIYASKPWGESEIHHEYSCFGKELAERSWTARPGAAAGAHHEGAAEDSH